MKLILCYAYLGSHNNTTNTRLGNNWDCRDKGNCELHAYCRWWISDVPAADCRQTGIYQSVDGSRYGYVYACCTEEVLCMARWMRESPNLYFPTTTCCLWLMTMRCLLFQIITFMGNHRQWDDFSPYIWLY